MTPVNLTENGMSIITGNDSIVIVDNFQSIRGGRTLGTVGFTPEVIRAGHVIIQETATKDYKPMPATDSTTGNVATLGALVAGTGYTNGTYENVPLIGSATGTGALATIVVAATVVSSVTITNGGKNYQPGDVLSALNTTMGGTGSGYSSPVATIGSTTGTYGTLPAGHIYAGILVASILTKKPFAGIMVRGTVNPAAAAYSMTSILSAVKTALPLIDFRED